MFPRKTRNHEGREIMVNCTGEEIDDRVTELGKKLDPIPKLHYTVREIDKKIYERPWGNYEILYEDTRTKVKRIVVYPGKRLSLQSHSKRMEDWIIVSGKGRVTKTWPVKYYPLSEVQPTLEKIEFFKLRNYDVWVGASIMILLGEPHRIENIGNEPLVFIEVQTGESFDEDDIIRYADDYGRV